MLVWSIRSYCCQLLAIIHYYIFAFIYYKISSTATNNLQLWLWDIFILLLSGWMYRSLGSIGWILIRRFWWLPVLMIDGRGIYLKALGNGLNILVSLGVFLNGHCIRWFHGCHRRRLHNSIGSFIWIWIAAYSIGRFRANSIIDLDTFFWILKFHLFNVTIIIDLDFRCLFNFFFRINLIVWM